MKKKDEQNGRMGVKWQVGQVKHAKKLIQTINQRRYCTHTSPAIAARGAHFARPPAREMRQNGLSTHC